MSLIADLASSRVALVILGCIAFFAITLWMGRARRKRIASLMQDRAEDAAHANVDGPPTARSPLEAQVAESLRRALEDVMRAQLGPLRATDAIASDLGLRHAEILSLIGQLETRLDCSLPDSTRVGRMNVGELTDVLVRQLSRQGTRS